MQVIVKKKALEQFLKTIAEERSYHSARIDQISGEDKPVLPDAQVAMQLSTDTVPVEDPDFLPVNKKQLSGAASQIANQVSPDRVQMFYKGLKKLIRKTSEPKQYKGMSETDLMEALRPFVLREAKRSVSVGDVQGSSYSSDSGFDPGDAFDKFRAREDREEEEQPDTGFNPSASAFSPDVQDIIRQETEPPEEKTGRRRLVKTAKAEPSRMDTLMSPKGKTSKDEIDVDDIDIDSLTPEEREKVLHRRRMKRSAQLPGELRRKSAMEGRKISLADRVIGNANILIDILLKSGVKPLPSDFKDAKIDVTVTPKEYTDEVTTEDGRKIKFPGTYIRVKFSDAASPPRPDLQALLDKFSASDALHFNPDPEPYVEKLPRKKEYSLKKQDEYSSDVKVDYIMEPFPFTQEQYIDELERQYKIAHKARMDEFVRELKKKQRKEEDEDIKNALKSKKSKDRDATLQKKLSVVDAEERAHVILKNLAIYAEQGDKASFNKALGKLKMEGVVDIDGFKSMSDDDKTRLHADIVQKLGDQRTSFYSVSNMDYARSFLDDYSKYFLEDRTISTSDAASASTEQLFETFYVECFSRILEEVVDDMPEDMKDLASEVFMVGSNMPDYTDFIAKVSNVEAWQDLVHGYAKDAVMDLQDSLSKDIGVFYTLYTGMKFPEKRGDKETEEEYDLRMELFKSFQASLDIIDMSDIGKMRLAFEYLKLPVDIMKGVVSAAIVDFINDNEDFKMPKGIPDKTRRLLTNIIKGVQSSDDPNDAIDLLASDEGKIFRSAGINDMNTLLTSSVEDIIGKVEEKTKKAAAKKLKQKIDSPDVDSHVSGVVDAFMSEVGNYFSEIDGEKAKDVYDYLMSYYEFDAKENYEESNPETDISEVLKSFVSTVENKFKAKKEKKEKKAEPPKAGKKK